MQPLLPLIELLPTVAFVDRLVGEVVGGPGEGIERVHVGTLVLRDPPPDGEVLIVAADARLAVGERFRDREGSRHERPFYSAGQGGGRSSTPTPYR